MSVLRPLLSRRGRLVFVPTALLLVAALVAAPSISGAKPPNAVKQFTATISPTSATAGVAVPSPGISVTVTNCGGPAIPDPRCTLSSTIGLGSIRIFVPIEFRPIGTPVPSSPNWTASYDQATGNINANVIAGSSKLQPGQSVDITFSATPTCSSAGDKQFTTAAWGSTTISGSDPFAIQPTVGGQPIITLAANDACVASGGTVFGPGEQTETITGDFTGHLLVTFGGDLDCNFGTFGDQWFHFHLPTQVNITPGGDFHAGNDPKISTSRFPAGTADSSSYLICFASLTDFITRGGYLDPPTDPTHEVEIDGTVFHVGILPNCYDPVSGQTRPEPCVSEQFLDLDTHEIVISVRMPPGDPYKR
jgi:hypothetical protein